MKKILSVILVILQLLTVTAFAEGSQITDAQKEDLYNLGIMTGDENGDLRLKDNITRAEAAKMICAAGNISLPSSDIQENIFADISVSHWAYKYIHAARENGIVNGDDKGNFNPESSITNEEIVKMLVCLLGYGEAAEQQGGYPAGYTAIASKIGITDSLKLQTKTPAIRSDVAVMIANSLDIPIAAEKTEGEDDDIAYVILNGKNGIPFATIRGTRGMTWDTSLTNIERHAQAFASQYPYKEGDMEKTFALYPDAAYSSGLEKTAEGVEYECPALYDDRYASDLVDAISVKSARLVTEGLSYEIQYAVFGSKVLVPYDIFKLAGCEALFNRDSCVATISKGDTTLELLPNLTGMRKNREEGYWVPLEACARFVNDTLYLPFEAIAEELGCTAAISAEELQ